MINKLKISLFIITLVFTYQYPVTENINKEKPDDGYFLNLSNNMKILLDEHVLPVIGEKRKLDKIVELIFDRSIVGFEYSGLKTFTAGETFDERSGNCLSYTTMFIAMARYAGLKAKFQEVSDFSNWNRRGDLVVFSSHINSVVEIGARAYEVDFQYRIEKKFWNRKIIDDKRAEAHYFNNIGSEALLNGDYSLAGEFLRRSISLDNSFSFAWSNLGVLFKKRGKIKESEEYFCKAVMLDKKNHTAKLNLAGLYESQGLIKKSEKLKNQIKKTLKMNPYYHFNLGVSEYYKKNYRGAVDNIKRAIRRDNGKSEFYIKLSAAYYKLGDLKMSRKYLEKGQKFADSDSEKDKYKKKLEYIHIKLKQVESD